MEMGYTKARAGGRRTRDERLLALLRWARTTSAEEVVPAVLALV